MSSELGANRVDPGDDGSIEDGAASQPSPAASPSPSRGEDGATLGAPAAAEGVDSPAPRESDVQDLEVAATGAAPAREETSELAPAPRAPWEWRVDADALEPWLRGDSRSPGTRRGAASTLEGGRGRARRLDPEYVTASRLSGAILTSGVALASLIGAMVTLVASDITGPWSWVLCIALSVFTLVIGTLSWVWPALEYRRIRYRVGSRGIEIKRGVIWRHVISVPFSRIQHTDVGQGPIERRFDLASLVVHTAGTHAYEVTLSGVAHGDALAIRDALLEARGHGA